MNNLTNNNKNQLTIEEWFTNKNQGSIDLKEIQRFKSNVLAIKNQLGLSNANLSTILEACYQATLLQLPLEKNFGYCWVVPFKGKAQFQMGYKGYIQLAMRSQQYKLISTSDVRLGELKKIDRLKGIKFNWIQNELERLKAPIIGYVAYFKMKNGQEKTLYMSKEEIENHFNTYSETYKKNKKFIVSSFEAMALKTVLTQLLRKWGIMSVEMQTAYESDQAIILEDEKIYIDNPNNNNEETLSKLKELEKEEKIIENFEI